VLVATLCDAISFAVRTGLAVSVGTGDALKIGNAVVVGTPAMGEVKLDGAGFWQPKKAIALKAIANVMINLLVVFILLLLNSGSLLERSVDS